MAYAKSCCYGEPTRMLPGKLHSPATEFISSGGEFKEADFKNFLKSVKLHEDGVRNYVVIAIVGPQNSGKSTLMNRLFHTNFEELNALLGSQATTKGMWIAKAPQTEPLTIVVDLEGTDGRGRGQDDTAFERQSALFAVVVADVLIINMWCHDYGREHAGNRPLLKAIFEAMMRLFGHHKTTLLFVLRDKTKTPIETLESDVKEDAEKIWKTAIKPRGHENTRLCEIFNVEFVALSNYQSKPDIFAEEVAKLRSRLLDSMSTTRRQNIIPFSSAKKVWDMIKGCKDLHLPSHKVMVATVRCEEIAMEKLSLFASDKDWLLLQEAAASKLVEGFSTRISLILNKYLYEYDGECRRYEEDVSKAKREYLVSEASKVVLPAYVNTLGHRRSKALRSFKTELKSALSEEGRGFAETVRTCKEFCVLQFDEQCGTDDSTFSNYVTTARRELLLDIKNHWLLDRADSLQKIAEKIREGVSCKFSRELSYFLIDCDEKDLWASIRALVKRENDATALALPTAVAEFELEPGKFDEMVDDLKQRARELMVKKFKEETKDVPKLLKQRFVTASMLIKEESAGASDEVVEEYSYRECVKLLSTMAVIRLDEGDDDRVESVLLSALMAPHQISPVDPLASHTWEQVPPEKTLITPAKCRDIWNRFKQEMEQHYATALHVQEQCNKSKLWRPVTWVIMGFLALGSFAAFMFLTRVCRMKVTVAMLLIANGINVVAEGIGLDVVAEAVEIYKDLRKVHGYCIGFRRRFRNLMEKTMQALKKFYKYMKSFIVKGKSSFEKEEAIVVSAN